MTHRARVWHDAAMPALRLLVPALLLPVLATACAWIPRSDLDAARMKIDDDPVGALGFELLDSPAPGVLSACALPAQPVVRVAFGDAFAGRGVTLEAQLDSADDATPIDNFDLPDVPSPTLEVPIPVPVGACPSGCSTVTLIARATDAEGNLLEQSLVAPLEVLPFSSTVSAVQLGETDALAVQTTPATAVPPDALPLDQNGTVRFQLTAPGGTALADLAPVVEACTELTCSPLPTSPDPQSPPGATPGDLGGFSADLTGLPACDTVLPPTVTLQVRLTSTAFTPEGGCLDTTLDLGLPEARYVQRDCDGDQQEAMAWGGPDCDDQQVTVFLDEGAPELLCDQLDNNCDGDVDVLGPFYTDGDNDGWGDELVVNVTCADPPDPDEFALVDGDCDDTEAAVHPGLLEVPCDTLDNDCDPMTLDDDQQFVWFDDSDGDSFGDPMVTQLTSCPALLVGDFVTNGDDCAPLDATEPQTYGLDVDTDQLGDPADTVLTCADESDAAGRVPNIDDCDDTEASIGAPDRWFPDADGDGLGTPGVGTESCTPIADHATNDWDCDDGFGYPDQASGALILADGQEFSASTFDWDDADTYDTVEICPSPAGAVAIPTTTLSGMVVIASPTAARMPVLPDGGVTSSHLFTIDDGTVTLLRLDVQGQETRTGDGGCFDVRNDGSLVLIDTQVTGCSATGIGGAVYVEDASLDVLDGSTLHGNSAGRGGAIGCVDGEATVEDSTLAGNHASTEGGAAFASACSLSIVSSTLDDNTAIERGGAVALQASAGAQIQDVLARRNTAPAGSAFTTGSLNAMPLLGGPPLALTEVEIVSHPTGSTSTVFVDADLSRTTPDLTYTDVTIPIQTDDFDVAFENGASVFLIGTSGSCSQATGGCSP